MHISGRYSNAETAVKIRIQGHRPHLRRAVSGPCCAGSAERLFPAQLFQGRLCISSAVRLYGRSRCGGSGVRDDHCDPLHPQSAGPRRLPDAHPAGDGKPAHPFQADLQRGVDALQQHRGHFLLCGDAAGSVSEQRGPAAAAGAVAESGGDLPHDRQLRVALAGL